MHLTLATSGGVLIHLCPVAFNRYTHSLAGYDAMRGFSNFGPPTCRSSAVFSTADQRCRNRRRAVIDRAVFVRRLYVTGNKTEFKQLRPVHTDCGPERCGVHLNVVVAFNEVLLNRGSALK